MSRPLVWGRRQHDWDRDTPEIGHTCPICNNTNYVWLDEETGEMICHRDSCDKGKQVKYLQNIVNELTPKEEK